MPRLQLPVDDETYAYLRDLSAESGFTMARVGGLLLEYARRSGLAIGVYAKAKTGQLARCDLASVDVGSETASNGAKT
jgi:hypothetical protein